MLVLDFVNERELCRKPQRRFFRKKSTENNKELKRYSVNVNGVNLTVLELTENDLNNEDVLTFLRIYKGRVLVSEKFKEKEVLKKYLYLPDEYYQRALLSSLINQIETVNRGWKSVAVKIVEFTPHKEFYELVRLTKSVTLITPNNLYTEKFLKDCYYEYGAIVTVKKESVLTKNIVYLDLNEVDNNGRLMINAKGKNLLLYPDIKYFENRSEYQKLAPYNLEHNLICSAFSDK